MDKYHIYEEIGKGEFSQVFKGREKKKIEYVAIKRIEKSIMNKIVNEVQVMHKLNSAHMLKFHDWYETRNNLWLILEYCTGGDLEALIKQDGHLPETSVRIFGLDIIAAVKYIHSLGMLHCDVRPSNFLVDEYGILKLGDFKQTRKVPKDALGDTPLAARGTLPYMAPELFTAEGVHSFQSDFWAVGCVLYQMRRGHLPFGEGTLKVPTLIQNINTVEPVNSPLPVPTPEGGVVSAKLAHPPVTADLADLLLWLLEKSPMDRCNWETLSAHPFWSPNNPSVPTQLPAQPAYDAYCRELMRSHSQALESSSIAEFGVRLDGSLDFTSLHSNGGTHPPLGSGSTPLKLPQAVDSTPVRSGNATGSAPPGGNAAGKTGGIALATGGTPAAAPRDSATEALSTPPHGTAAGSGTQMANQITPERNTSAAQQAAQSLTNTQQKAHAAPPTASNTATTAAMLEQQQQQQQHRDARTPAVPSPRAPQSTPARTGALTNMDLPESDASFLRVAPAGGVQQRPQTTERQEVSQPAEDQLSAFPAHSLLLHSSDTQVKSIAGNKQIEAVEKIGCKPDSLPFPALTPDEVAQMSVTELESHLSVVYKQLQKTLVAAQTTIPTIAASNALFDRLGALGYLYTIASCAEVANIVLNTHFLHLILKIMKGSVVYSSNAPGARAHSTAGNNAAATLVNTMNANSVQARIWAATVLGLMLRFVSNLQPPTIRAREEHIVPSIVAILRDPAKIDVRLKRRVVAALGETVFYISTQAEEVGTERWNLPNQAVDALVDCLKDDNDEAVKHYAVKTIENVFAQGALEFRRRFVSLELAVRLMELAQSSKNEHLQGSSGMAAAHLLHVVQTAHHHPPAPPASAAATGSAAQTNLNSTGRVAVSSRGMASDKSSGNLNATATLNDLFSIPSAVRGAKFLAKVVEKGGLPGIIEVLRDGPQKLQQAYLNIINMVFSAPLPAPSSTGMPDVDEASSPANLQAINVALRMVRSFFLKSPTLLPHLVNMMEQGGLSAIRGKALIAAQLICVFSPQILSSLAERRLPNLLVRALSPVLAAQENEPNKPLAAIQLTYYTKTALSMLFYLRGVCITATGSLADQLAFLAANPARVLTEATGAPHGYDSPTKGTAAGRKASPSSPHTMHATPGVAAPADAAIAGSFSAAELQSQAAILSAVASTASQPSVRRMILTSSGEAIASFASALLQLPTSRAAMKEVSATAHQLAAKGRGSPSTPDYATIVHNLESALQDAERSCLIMLEMISQTEFIVNSGASVLFLEAVVRGLIPAAAKCLVHGNGDTRVVVSSALRRLVPSTLLACTELSQQSAPQYSGLLSAGLGCITAIVEHAPALLADQPPIPQYFIRLLLDIMSVSPVCAQAVSEQLVRRGAPEFLVKLLRPRPPAAGPDEEDAEMDGVDGNPQLALLLRQVYETTDCAGMLLRSDLGPILTEATIAAVYATMNDSLSTTIGRPSDRFSPSALPRHEGVMRLVELIQVVLYHIVRLQPKDAVSQQSNNVAELYRRQVAQMRVLSPALLTVIAYANEFLRANADNDAARGGPASDDLDMGSAVGAYAQLLDGVSRCLALLFDLFPDALTTQLLSKVSVLLDRNADQSRLGMLSPSRGTARGTQLLPRAVIAGALLNAQIDIKTRSRLLKVLHALCRVAANLNIGGVKELLTTEPLSHALQKSSRAADVATNMRTFNGSLHVDDINAFVRTAAQLCELGSHL